MIQFIKEHRRVCIGAVCAVVLLAGVAAVIAVVQSRPLAAVNGKDPVYLYDPAAVFAPVSDIKPASILKDENGRIVAVHYPVTKNSSVNRDIADFAAGEIEAFSSSPSGGGRPVFGLDFEITRFNSSLISIAFTKFLNGEQQMAMRSYNLQTGRQLLLGDLFLEDSEYLQRLSFEAQKNLIESGRLGNAPNIDRIASGTAPDRLMQFTLNGDQLILWFDAGKVADELAGIQYAEIKLKQLEDICLLFVPDGMELLTGPPSAADELPQAPSRQEGDEEGSQRQKQVAITFADGPDGETTEQILGLLGEYNARGTFFVLGNRVAYYPQELRRMVEEGHAVGSHSWSHLPLTRLTPTQISEELRKASSAVQTVTGQYPVLISPPFGLVGENVKSIYGMTVILGTIDVETQSGTDDAQTIAENVIAKVQDGSVITLHELDSRSVKVTQIILERLTEEGYRFVTVPELLELDG